MKKLFIFLAALLFPTLLFAATTLPFNGGTGSTTLSGILVGNGTSPINTLIVGNNLTLVGHTLTATGDGTASSTLLTDANTFSGVNKFSNSSSDFSGTWQTFSPSHFLTSLAGAASSTLLSDNNTFSGLDVFGDTGGVYLKSAGSGIGGIGWNSTPDGSYVAGVSGYGALMQLAPSTGAFTMYAEGNAAAGAAHSHTITEFWDGAGNVFFPRGFVSNASTTIGTLNLITPLSPSSIAVTYFNPLSIANNGTVVIATSSATQSGFLSASDFAGFNGKQANIGATTTNPFLATQMIATSSGTLASPSFTVTDGGGIYRAGANTLGLSNGTAGLSWNGNAFYPNTNTTRNLGIISTNVWSKFYVNAASSSDISVSNSLFFNFAGGLVYSGASNQALTLATSTPGVTAPITYSGTLGFLVGGSSGSFGCSTCLTANQTITLTGAVTGSGATSIATTYSTVGLSTGGTNASLSGANQMLFLNSANTAVSASSSFVFTGYNAHGIGTSTPWATLSVVGDGTRPYFAVATSTGASASSSEPMMMIDQNEHWMSGGGQPAIVLCGTASVVNGNDHIMRITTGTGGVTECTVNFAKTWLGGIPPVCQVDEEGTTATITTRASTTQTQLKIGLSASLTSASLGVQCEGFQ